MTQNRIMRACALMGGEKLPRKYQSVNVREKNTYIGYAYKNKHNKLQY